MGEFKFVWRPSSVKGTPDREGVVIWETKESLRVQLSRVVHCWLLTVPKVLEHARGGDNVGIYAIQLNTSTLSKTRRDASVHVLQSLMSCAESSTWQNKEPHDAREQTKALPGTGTTAGELASSKR